MTGGELMDRENEHKSICEKFQVEIPNVLARHKSILDVMTKSEEYNARTNRAIAKSVTECGCISISASKQEFGSDSLQDMLENAQSHIQGSLCEGCKDVLEEEIGTHLFYLTSLCEILGLELHSILEKQYDRIKTLGIYSLK